MQDSRTEKGTGRTVFLERFEVLARARTWWSAGCRQAGEWG